MKRINLTAEQIAYLESRHKQARDSRELLASITMLLKVREVMELDKRLAELEKQSES